MKKAIYWVLCAGIAAFSSVWALDWDGGNGLWQSNNWNVGNPWVDGNTANIFAADTLTLNTNVTATSVNSVAGSQINSAGGSFSLNLAGGTIAGTLTNGAGGTLALGVSGGAVVVSGPVSYSGATTVTGGSLTYSGGSSQTPTGALTVNGAGTVVNINSMYNKTGSQTLSITNGGAVNTNGAVTVGGTASILVGNGSAGTLSISGGTFNSTYTNGNGIGIGWGNNGNGTLNVTGGTGSFGAPGQPNVFYVGYGATNAVGAANVSGGTLNIGYGGSVAFIGGGDTGSGQYGTGQLNISGTGRVNVGPAGGFPADWFYFGGFGGAGTLNLNGGVLHLERPMRRGSGGTSTFNFNGGTLEAGFSNSNIFTQNGASVANIRNGGLTVDSNGFNITITHPLQHSAIGGDNAIDGGLTKIGTGTLVLTAANTYKGVTTINAGTLTLSQGGGPGTILTNTITVNNGGTLAFGNYNQLGVNAANPMPPVVVNTGGVVQSSATVNSFKNLTLNGGTLSGTGGYAPDSKWGAFALFGTLNVTEDSSILNTSGSFNTITPGNGNGNQALTIDVSAGKTLTNNLPVNNYDGSHTYAITKTGAGDAIFSGASTYTGGTTVNAGTLRLAGGNDRLLTTGDVTVNAPGIFDLNGVNQAIDALDGNGSVTLGGGRLTLGSSGGTAAFSGIISEAGGLTKTGSGTVTFSGANTYTGTTIIDNGTTNLSTVGAPSISDTIQLGAGNSNQPNLRMTQNNQFAGGVLMSFMNASGNWTRVDLQGTNQTLAGLNSVQLGGVIQNERAGGNGSITQAGTLTLNVSGANSYLFSGHMRDEDDNGTTYKFNLVKEGTGTQILEDMGHNAGYTSVTNRIFHSGNTIVNDGTLILRNLKDTGNNNLLTFKSPVQANGSGILEIDSSIPFATRWNYGQQISGDGTINKTGTGVFGITGVNTFDGQLNVMAGRLHNDGTTADWSGAAADVFVNAGAVLDLRADEIQVDVLTGAGEIWNSLSSGGNNNQLTLGVANGTGGDFSGIIRGNDTQADDNPDAAFLRIVKTGAGTQTLSGANTYAGTTVINNGILDAASNSALGSTAANTTVNSGGALQVSGNRTIAEALVLNGTGGGAGALQFVGGDSTLNGAVNLATDSSIAVEAARQGTLAGSVTGTVSLTKIGAGTLVLSGADTHTGTTTVSAGTLTYSGAGPHTPTGPVVVTGASSILNIDGTYTRIGTQQLQIINGGTVNTTGTVTNGGSGGAVFVGLNSTGTLNINGGTFNTTYTNTNGIGIGWGTNGNGTLNVTAGTASFGAAGLPNVFYVGYGATNALGFVNVTGGTLNIGYGGGRAFIGGGNVNSGQYGTGELNVSGTGRVNVGPAGGFPNERLYFGGHGGSGTLNLDGGVLHLERPMLRGNGLTSYFNFNGGILEAGISGIDLLAQNGASIANIRNGGITVDSNGFATTISHPLQHSTLGGDNAVDGGLTKIGTGTLTLTAVETYTGTTTVSAGTLRLSGGNDRLLTTGDVAVNALGILDLNGLNQTIDALDGNGAVALGAGRLTVGNNGGTGTFAGVIAGSGGLSKTGTGTQTFSGANTYTGTTIIDRGNTYLSTVGAPSISDTIQLGAGNGNQPNLFMTQDNQFAPGVLMTIANSYNNWTRINLMGTDQSLAGLSSLSGGGVIQNAPPGGGGVTQPGTLTLNVSGANSYTFQGHMRDQDNNGTTYKFNIIKEGTGTQVFTNISNNAGYTSVTNRTFYAGTTTVNDGRLIIRNLRDTGNNALYTFKSPVQVNGNGVLEFDSSIPAATGWNYSQAVSGSGTINKTSSGIFTMTGSSTFTGDFAVDGGTLAFGAAGAMGDPAAVHVAGGAVFDVSGAVVGNSFDASGSNPNTPVTYSGAGTITVGAGNSFAWTGGVTMAPGNSPGTLSVVGNVDWSGATGGTYDWQVYDANGGAGVGYDLIDITGSLDMTGGSGTINGIGLANLPNVAGLPLNVDMEPGAQTLFEIIRTTAGVIGFGGFSPTFVNNMNHRGFFKLLLGNGGNSVYLLWEATPEPGTWVLFGVLALAGVVTIRRRKPATA